MIYKVFAPSNRWWKSLGFLKHQPVSRGVTMLQDPPEKPEGLDEAPKVLRPIKWDFPRFSFVFWVNRKFKAK